MEQNSMSGRAHESVNVCILSQVISHKLTENNIQVVTD